LHPDFEEGHENIYSEKRIRFKLKEELKHELGEYTFYLKVTADGGDFFWVGDGQYTFDVRCGIGSTNMEAPLMDQHILYTIDEN